MMIVTNVSDQQLTTKSRLHWLSYWSHFNTSDYCYCAEANCTNKHQHGVLVSHRTATANRLYVVPLCEEHSYGYQNQIEIDERVDIVPAELSL
ncbi:hypothetical protein [Vibrio sp. MACH09]|uniref:hypothetical protein n=1 Tax=Vibrio sp. MACH09 TaxID=3025122 RepID=UPI00295F5A81|nr:hypothetical protein [Vibrio sp. MACH09]